MRNTRPTPARPRTRSSRWLLPCLVVVLVAVPACSDSKKDKPAAAEAPGAAVPAPPKPEPISVRELPLPPVAPSDEPGACTAAINPHGTGCHQQERGLPVRRLPAGR